MLHFILHLALRLLDKLIYLFFRFSVRFKFKSCLIPGKLFIYLFICLFIYLFIVLSYLFIYLFKVQTVTKKMFLGLESFIKRLLYPKIFFTIIILI